MTGAEGPGCFPGNDHPGQPHQPDGAGAAQPVPAAERDDRPPLTRTTTPSRRCRTGRATTRCCAWTGTWRRTPRCTDALQFGYEKRAGGVSFLGSTGAGWPQQPSKYEIDTVSYVNTLLHTFNPTLFGEVTVGVNWSHQYTSAFDDAARLANDRTVVLPALRQFFPSANPDNLMPQASFTGGPGGNIGSFNVEPRWPFFGYNDAVELLRQHHEDQGFAQPQDRAVRRAHHPPGSALLDLQRIAELQLGRFEPAQHQRRFRQRAARRRHPVPGGRRPSGGARPVHEHRVLRAGQLAREAELHHRRGHALLLPHPDTERRRPGAGLQPQHLVGGCGAAAVRHRLDATGSSSAEPGHRRDSPVRVRGTPGAGHRGLHQRDRSVRGHAAAEQPVQAGAAYRLRVGRHRRWTDGRTRRRRRVLRSLLGRRHPRSRRAAAGPEHLHHQLHDPGRAAGQLR